MRMKWTLWSWSSKFYEEVICDTKRKWPLRVRFPYALPTYDNLKMGISFSGPRSMSSFPWLKCWWFSNSPRQKEQQVVTCFVVSTTPVHRLWRPHTKPLAIVLVLHNWFAQFFGEQKQLLCSKRKRMSARKTNRRWSEIVRIKEYNNIISTTLKQRER